MLRHYLTTVLRYFRRDPAYTLLNLTGLALGIATTLLILLFITDELRYDQYHERGDRIYRISSDITEPDDAFKWSVTQFPLAPTLKEEFAEVERSVRFIPAGRVRLEFGNQSYFTEKAFVVDSTVFDVFTYPFLHGDPETALEGPYRIVLSEGLSRRLFGEDNPVGKMLGNDDEQPYEVTGVYRDPPRQSHLIAEAMISASTIENLQNAGSWGGFSIYSYVMLKPGSDPAAFEAKLQEVIDKYVASIFDELGIRVKYVLMPLRSIHLTSDFEGEPEPVGNVAYIYIFGALAVFLLAIAAINYMNLATARSTERGMEVGIRKVLGSGRGQLIGRFLSESLLLTFCALVVAYGLVLLLLPSFNRHFGLELEAGRLFSAPVILGALAIWLVVGLLSGSYPAFYLSGFQPIRVLKGRLARDSGNPGLRKVLVGLQFAITLFMILGTGVIFEQMRYVREKDLGFDKQHVLTFPLGPPEGRSKWTILRQRLLQSPDILAAGTAGTTMGRGFSKNILRIETANGQIDQRGIDWYGIDYEFFPTMGVDLVEGRNFSSAFRTDSTLAVLVNEAMVERMGWKEALGKKVYLSQDSLAEPAQVIGVVGDFHQRALYEPIEALLFYPNANNRIAHVRFAGSAEHTIHYIEGMWNEFFPDQPFEYDFVDENLMELYEADFIRSRIFTLFASLMIIIACLGLLGLASYTAEQRSKEIGIRKIMGASTPDILLLLTGNYVVLILLAAVPAFLAAWWVMGQWLNTFVYHKGLNIWLFPLALALTLAIALATTSYHAYRASQRNPVRSLRYE